jgi:NDP-sugar pyrophosphorylase family protein
LNAVLCILAAGRGSRLGPFTASINKALLPVAHRAAISHIIEKVPEEIEIVVALGYEGEKVAEYCQAAFPTRAFHFVAVDKLNGPGSGPGYSLNCCKPLLHRPFYLCNADTLVTDPFPSLAVNWVGVAPTVDPELYATAEVDSEDRLIDFRDKSPHGYDLAYIGLAGILDWEIFWKQLEKATSQSLDIQYIEAFKDLTAYASGGGVWAVKFDWHDIGTVEGYRSTCLYYDDCPRLGMEKTINEVTYKDQGQLIKLCWDAEKNQRRVHRSRQLAGTEVLSKGVDDKRGQAAYPFLR